MAGERPVVFGFAEVALVLIVLHFFATSLALAAGLGSGIGSFLEALATALIAHPSARVGLYSRWDTIPLVPSSVRG